MDTNEYKDIFEAEARDYLQVLNELLLKMENEPDNTDYLGEMFRAAHSLKGMSATMGYENIASLTHTMENVLDQLRNKELTLIREIADILFEGLDLLEGLLNQLDDPDAPIAGFNTVLSKFKQVEQTGTIAGAEVSEQKEESQKAVDNSAEEPKQEKADTEGSSLDQEVELDEFEKEVVKSNQKLGKNVYYVGIELIENCLLKSVRAYMVIKSLEKFGDIVKVHPPIQDLEEEKFETFFYVLCQTDANTEEIRDELETISEIETITIRIYNPDLESMAEEDAAKASAAAAEAEPVPKAVDANNQEAKSSSIKSAEAKGKPLAKSKANKPQAATSPAKTQEKTMRVETDKLDKLINLVGELVINRTRVVELGKDKKSDDQGEMQGALEQLDRITTDLQSAVMKLRMVPIKQVFDRFPRMVRDQSNERGKKVQLKIIGEDTELDRSIVNQIGDPLVHLLRNALDHGIEASEERVKIGKDETSVLVLEARHEGSFVVIEVQDDGKGIDPDRIRQSAIKKGVISEEEANQLTDKEAVNLVFQSGFSTAEKVTDISGRGVGMDAVRNVIESLSGTVEVETETGKGSTFTIRLPLTLAIIKALLVGVDKEVYAIPIESIRENLHITGDEVKTIQGEEVISLRKEVLPLISLQERLGFGREERGEVIPVVVVKAGNKKGGLMVDELLGQQEIVIKSLSKILGEAEGIAGATVLGSGRVALILNISTLI